MRNLSTPATIMASTIILSVSILLHALIVSGYLQLKQLRLPGTNAETQGIEPLPDSTGDDPQKKYNVSEDNDPSLGSKDAKVVIVEFSDFQCPFCKRLFDETIQDLKTEYIDKGLARLVYRDFPLSFHANAQIAAEAGECANEQGSFWPMHDKLFVDQDSWANLSNADAKKKFSEYASGIGLNVSNFGTCLESGKYTQEVKKDTDDGSVAGVSGTPTLFINGTRIVGAQPYSTFKTAIDKELQ